MLTVIKLNLIWLACHMFQNTDLIDEHLNRLDATDILYPLKELPLTELEELLC